MSPPRAFWEEAAAAILVFVQTVSCVFFLFLSFFFFMASRSKIKYIFFMTMPGSAFC